MLASLRRRLEAEKEKHYKLFLKLRKHIPAIVEIGAAFNVEQIVLFGSITDKEHFSEISDIDIGLIGIKAEEFFKLYSQLTERIEWPIDLVDLDEDPKFKAMILKKGEVIYDRNEEIHGSNTGIG